jgi:hypothetical protein
MKCKILATLLAGLLATPLSGTLGFASGKGKSGSKSDTKLQAKLTPVIGSSVEDFEGKVKYKKKTSSKGSEEEIEAKVESPIPNATLGIVDENSAADSTLLLKIMQGSTTTEKGSCILLLKEIEFEYQQGVALSGLDAKFAAKVKEKTPLSGIATLSKKVGTCQVLSAVNNVPTLVDGVPDVAVGDTAAIYALPPTPGSTPLLSGIFQSGHRR